MAKNKTHKNIEHYLGIIRGLKSEVRQLKRKITELEKKDELTDTDYDAEDYDVIDTNLCKNCGKGKLEELDLGIRSYTVCKLCKDRKLVKKAKT